MGMFDKYDNLNPEYIPDNSSPEINEEHISINKVLPRILNDVRNRFIGYSWNHREYFDFKICVDNMIKIREDSLVYDKEGQKPDDYTIGKYEGQKAYNTVDAKSWTYVGRTESVYVWVEDCEVLYPIDGEKSIIINRDMTNSYITVNIFNFRWESVYIQQSEIGQSTICIEVNEELSKTLTSGIYYCTVTIHSEDNSFLKDKFMISIN